MKILRLFAVIVVSVLFAGGASAQNILANGDFETGDLTGWVLFGLSGASSVSIDGTDNGPSAPGTYNAFLDNQAEALGLGLKQTTPVGTAAGGDVDYSFDLKLDEANLGGVFFVEIFAEADGVGIVGGSGLMGPFWAWQWTAYSGSFTAPAATDFMTIQFVATTGATVGSTCIGHVDNVVIEQPNVVSNDAGSLDSVKALFR